MRLEDALKIQNEHIGALGKAMRRLESELQQAATNKHQDAQPSEKVHSQALMNRDVRYADLQRQMNALKDENLVAGFRSRRIEDVPDEPPGRSAQRAPDSVLFPGQTMNALEHGWLSTDRWEAIELPVEGFGSPMQNRKGKLVIFYGEVVPRSTQATL